MQEPDAQETRHPPAAVMTVAFGAGFGVLGDILFYRSGLGINAPLWMGALAVAAWVAYRRTGRPAGALPGLLAAGVFFAGCLAWRGSPFLRAWSLVAVAAATVAIAVQLRGALGSARIADYVRGALEVAGDLVAGPVRLVGAIPPSRSGAAGRRAAATTIGVVLAVPVVLVFGALLAAADPAMDAFLRSLVTWDLETVAAHLAIFGGTAWLAAGGLWRIGLADRGPAPAAAPAARTLGAVELGIPLAALTLLLTAFIGLQTRYLFGGEAFVRGTGITYAEFARRGFFELVALAALTLPVLLAAQYAVDRRARAALESFRALAAAIAILVGLVMLSAGARMWLYVRMYGLTEDRFYASAFMLWVGAVLAWYVLTELRGRLERFATGAVAAGFLVLAALNVANPDAVIARVNLRRAAAGAALDAAYLARLSTDAVPALASRWSALDPAARCALEARVLRDAERAAGWRAWTWSTWRASRALAARSIVPGCGPG